MHSEFDIQTKRLGDRAVVAVEEARREQEQKVRLQRLSLAGIPPRAAEALTQPLEEHGPWGEAYRRLVKRLSARGMLVVLLGIRGPGKTVMGCKLIEHACVAMGKSGRYIKLPTLSAEFADAKIKGLEIPTMQKYVKPDLLVIDEMGEGKFDAIEMQRITTLLDHRYDEFRWTLLISNQTRADFAKRFGDSIVSRVHETGEAIECTWPSFREAKHD